MTSLNIKQYEYIDIYQQVLEEPNLKNIINNMDRSEFYLFRLFNPSIAKLNNGIYLYSFRIDLIANTENNLKPGNDTNCIQNYHSDQNDRYDKNFSSGYFWWNNWSNPNIKAGSQTIFCIKNRNGFEVIKSLTYPKCNYSRYMDISFSDLRIFNFNNSIYLQSTNLSFIYNLIYYSSNKNKNLALRLFNVFRPNLESKNLQVTSMGTEPPDGWCNENKLIYTNDHPHSITYIDWFLKDGVKFVKKISEIYTNNNKYADEHYISYNKNYPLYGKGSYIISKYDVPNYELMNEEQLTKTIVKLNDEMKQIFKYNYGIMPALSFTSPHIHIDNKQLGIGHIKIHSDTIRYKYLNGSNIENFRNNLYNDMSAKYGDKYIKHYGSVVAPDCEGFIYMMYFYILSEPVNDKPGFFDVMKISDAFLPINLNPHKKHGDYDIDEGYKFSLIFPSGLEYGDDPNEIIVTAGEGDFYAIQLKFDLNEVIASCKHEVSNLPMSTYQYHILGWYKEKTYQDIRLNNILEQLKINQQGGYHDFHHHYYKKYMKYKLKYIALKNF